MVILKLPLALAFALFLAAAVTDDLGFAYGGMGVCAGAGLAYYAAAAHLERRR